MTQIVQMMPRNAKLDEIRRAIESVNLSRMRHKEPEKKELPKNMNRQKCERFSDYMTDLFVNTCNHETISGRFQNWKDKSDAEKLKLASDIINVFLSKLGKEITQHRVPIYQRDGTEYEGTNDKMGETITADIAKMPEITVKPIEQPKPNDAMYVSSKRELFINMQNPGYKSSPSNFLTSLRHEFTHIVDMFIPSISPLEPEVREEAMRSYVRPDENKELYEKNPLELNANMKKEEYKQRIDAMLTLQETERNRAMNMNYLSMMMRGYGRAA